MSESSEKGVSLEKVIAKLLRTKLGVKVVRDSRSGAGINKSDMNDYWREVPLFIEAKNHKNIDIKKFFRQAKQGASVGQAPTVVFNMDDEEILACLPFEDLVNFLVEIRDMKAEIAELRKPVEVIWAKPANITVNYDPAKPGADKTVKTCRNGHMSDNYGYCMQVTCKYSRGYRPPKVKR